MSTPLSALYRRAQMRLAVSLLLSAVGAFAVPFASITLSETVPPSPLFC